MRAKVERRDRAKRDMLISLGFAADFKGRPARLQSALSGAALDPPEMLACLLFPAML
jgi:hypothetical protein